MSVNSNVHSCAPPAHLVLNENGIPVDPLDKQLLTIGTKRYKYDGYRQKWYIDNDWDRIRKRNALFREKRNQGLGTKESWRDAFTVYPPVFEDPNTGNSYIILETNFTFPVKQ